MQNSFSGPDNEIMMALWMLSAGHVPLFVFFPISFPWIFSRPHEPHTDLSWRTSRVVTAAPGSRPRRPRCSCGFWQGRRVLLGNGFCTVRHQAETSKENTLRWSKAWKAEDSIEPLGLRGTHFFPQGCWFNFSLSWLGYVLLCTQCGIISCEV